jgi:hypothetical protein
LNESVRDAATYAWRNGSGNLRRWTDRDGKIVDLLLLSLATALVTVHARIRDARGRQGSPPRRLI